MTDFSRYEKQEKHKKQRPPIRWGFIGNIVVWAAILAVPAAFLYFEGTPDSDTFKFSFGVGVDVKIDSKPTEAPVEPDPTLTLEKLRDFYDTKESLTDLAFARADALLKGERITFFATLVNVEEGCCTGKEADITIDPGIEWDDRYDDTELELTFDVDEERLTEWASWKRGEKLKFECTYDEVSGSVLLETPRWESCTITAIR